MGIDKQIQKNIGNLERGTSGTKERLKDPVVDKKVMGKELEKAYREGADEDFKVYQEWGDTIGDGFDPKCGKEK
jgi:hypothetical protein